MSDDQLKDNLPGNEPDIKGGWHQPQEATLWQSPNEDNAPPNTWQSMSAFPADLDESPQEQGGWHLPAPEHTILSKDTEIQKGQPIIVESEEETSPEAESGELSPEDMIAQILGQQPTSPKESLGAPEDIVADIARKPETDTPSDEELEDEVDDLLDSLDDIDGDDDPFDVDERSALMSLADAEDDDTSDEDDSHAALYDAVKRATDEIPELTQEQIDNAETPTPADSTGDDASDAADYARQMLAQFDNEEENSSMTGLLSGTLDLGEKADTTSGTVDDPAEVARRMLAQLDDESGTGVSDSYGTQPLAPPAQQPQQAPILDPQTRAIAERFQSMQNQVATLNRVYQDGGMNYDEYQRQLYDKMVQDDDGVWWMIGANSDKWYRHDVASNQWEEGYPAELAELEQYNQTQQPGGATGYESAPQTYDLPSVTGEFPQGSAPQQVGDTRYDDFGVPIGTVQPEADDQYTVPNEAPWQTSIQDQQQTVPSDGGYDATVVSPSTYDDSLQPTIPMESQAGGFGNDAIGSARDASQPGDFSLDEPAPTVQKYQDEQRANTLRILTFAVVGVIALGLISIIAGVVMISLWYSNAVQPYQTQIAALANYNPPFQTARIFDANGDLIVELNSQETGARTAIPLEDMSPFIIHAIISQENERFYEDPGFDPIAILRAFMQNITGGGIESGASTITQQIARNLVLQDTEITAERKINEILVALEIANQYDKNFILELYLNEIFFGNQSYGVEAASQFYFEHGSDELNFAESALLASIVPSPAQNDPVVNRPTAIDGMRATMRKMMEVECLQFQHGDWIQRGPFCINTNLQVSFQGDNVFLIRTNSTGEINGGLSTLQIAEIETAEYVPRNVRLQYPHFVNFVQSQIEAQFGTNALFQRGFNIHTTLIPSVQDTAEDALETRVAELVDTGVNTGSVMVTDPTSGAIRAMVGSHDFTDEVAGQVNNALTFQQPGSAIKPIVYTAALVGNQGRFLTPASILWDVPVTYNVNGSTYTPVNFDRQFHGAIPLRFALQNSFNVAAVKAFAFIGGEQFVQMAQALGLRFPENTSINLPSALGANEVRLIDMMEAYGTFANNGQRVPLHAIERITETVEGEQVEVPLGDPPEPIQAISPQAAYLMQNILSDDNARAGEFGTNSNLTLARLGVNPSLNRVSAKTGTSNDSRDLWTMGFTRNVVVGVWLGTYDNSPTFNTTGFNSAAPVWNVVMEAALRGRTPPEFPNPGGVITQQICRTTGTLFYDGCPERSTGLFIQDKFPPPPDQGFVQTIPVDSWTGLRANEFCQDFIVEQTFANIEDGSAVEWLNTTGPGRAYAQAVGLPIPLQQAPANACSQGQSLPTIALTFPNANQEIEGNVTIAGQVMGPDFARYELAYATAQQPESWIPIGSPSTTQVQTRGQPLGTWDTTQVSNGNYIIRLAVFSNSGGSIFLTAPVVVDNILPTPTPTDVPLPTLDTSASSTGVTAGTAIPFPDLNPTATP